MSSSFEMARKNAAAATSRSDQPRPAPSGSVAGDCVSTEVSPTGDSSDSPAAASPPIWPNTGVARAKTALDTKMVINAVAVNSTQWPATFSRENQPMTNATNTDRAIARTGPTARTETVPFAPWAQITETNTSSRIPDPMLIQRILVGHLLAATTRASTDPQAKAQPMADSTESGADADKANHSSLTPWLKRMSGASAMITRPNPKTLWGAQRVSGRSQNPAKPAHLGTMASIKSAVPAAIPHPLLPRSSPWTDDARKSQVSSRRSPELALPKRTSR